MTTAGLVREEVAHRMAILRENGWSVEEIAELFEMSAESVIDYLESK